MKKKIIPIFILLIVFGTGLYLRFGRERNTDLVLRGEIEGTTYSQVSEVSGKIVEMSINLGGPVKAGDLIARLDSTDQQYALEQLQIQLEKRRLTLRNLLNGAKQEDLEMARNNISIAETNYRSAEASYNQAQNDTKTLASLLEFGGVAQNDLDKARLNERIAAEALEAARVQIENAREQLSQLQKGADYVTIALAENDINETESKIRQMQEALDKYEIKANCDGIVISINYNLGSMVNVGYNIADISASEEKYVVCYVPTEYSRRILYDQLVTVRFDREEYQGEVRFIDVKSQYTPKDMQTSSMKNKVSVKVKLLMPPHLALTSGHRGDVVIR